MLFGHQNDDAAQPAPTPPAVESTNLNPLAIDPATGASLPVAPPEPPLPPPPSESSILNQPISAASYEETPTAPPVDPVVPFMSDLVSVPSLVVAPPAPIVSTPEPELEPAVSEPSPFETPAAPILPVNETEDVTSPDMPAVDATSEATVSAPDNSSLLALKQQALAQLEPLVDQLDQTPEEKFRTTMMLLQSTDNQALIQDAYDAAQAITDEKVRAQALLDVINEINYFTQTKSAS